MGVQGGLEECKHQFAWDRWNCPDSATQLRGLRRGELTRMQASVLKRVSMRKVRMLSPRKK